MTNRMNEIAKLLGVELEEVFKITDDTHDDYQRYLRFTKNAGIEISDDGVEWEMAGTVIGAMILKFLLMGNVRIVKLPWKPKMGERYYVSDIFDRDLFDYYLWDDDERDEELYKRGLVFKTKEEAIELAQRMLAVAKESKNND